MQVIPTSSSSTTATTSTSTIFNPDYTLTPTQSREAHPPILLGVSPTKPCPLSATPRAVPTITSLGSPMPSPTPRRRVPSGTRLKAKVRDHSNTKPNVKYDTFSACMEGGIAHETRSQALAHAGPSAERHLRAAAALFESALAYQPAEWPALRLATVQYHLSTHCRPPEAADLLRAARLALLDQDSGPATEVRAAICARLAALLRLPSDTQHSEAGQAASEALDAFEDVAAERMDRASALSKSEFEAETPALAATFLALAEAAAAVCTLSPDPESADAHAELADHALAHAANMATLSRAPALVTHIQLTSARLAAERLRYFSNHEESGAGWAQLLLEMGILASQTRERAQKLRESRGAVAAEQAAEAVKLLADARVMHAQCLGVSSGCPPLPFSPCSARSIPTARTMPISPTLATPITAAWSPSPPDPTPGLSSSRSGSWSSSTDSPPIPEEPEPEDADQLMPKIVSNTPGTSSVLLSPTNQSPTRKRAPPPPPLKLLEQRPPRPPPGHTPLHPPPLSPLNPARRASDQPARPRLFRGPSYSSPRRASWMSPTLEDYLPPIPPTAPALTPLLSSVQQQWNQLAAAGKGYKLALSVLSNANLPLAERARRKSELLFAVATTALVRADIAPLIATPTPALAGSQGGGSGHTRSLSGSYFSPTASHASPESIKSLVKLSHTHSHVNRSLSLQSAHAHHPHGHMRHHTYPRSPTIQAFVRIAPATPRPDPRSGTRVAGAAALRATAEVYATWAAREVGWSAVIDPSGAGADRRTGAIGADEAGLRAVLLAVRVWWVRASAGDEPDEVEVTESDEDEQVSASGSDEPLGLDHDERENSGSPTKESPGGKEPSTRTFGLHPLAARRIMDVLSRLRDEGAGADDLRRFLGPFALCDEERRFWTEVEDVLSA